MLPASQSAVPHRQECEGELGRAMDSMRVAPKPMEQRLLAPSFGAGGKPSPLPSSCISRAKRRRLPGIRCSPGSPEGGDGGAPPVVRAAVGAVTELLRALSPKKLRDDDVQNGAGGGAELMLPCSVDDVVAVLEADYQRAYFLTGNFTPDIYAEDCLFEDPTIKFRGRSRYSQNLDLLVPFFDNPSLELESIEKGLRVETKFIIATWTLRTYLRLPWRPLISIRGSTTYDLDGEYKVTRHTESWDVSALEAIGQIFVSAPKQMGS